MRYRWQLADLNPEQTKNLADELGVSALLAQCLLNRAQSTSEAASRYLDPRLKNLSDPFLLPDMDRAVDRLARARDKGEALVIFGDYDVDGVTATALLTEALRELGLSAAAYLPHRFTEGYGLSQSAVDNCMARRPVSLLLAVDCGATSVEVIQGLNRRGVDVIVLDHHPPGPVPPPAAALVNPHCAGPREASFRELCAAGLAFKLAHALVKRGRSESWPGAAEMDVRRWLDLVALATIADLVPLIGENRILVNRGLERLESTARPGLRALIEVAGISKSVGSYEVAFQLAPRLNAAGRLETARDALQLLTTQCALEAKTLAERLNTRNRDRQSLERTIASEVIRSVRSGFDPGRDYVIVAGAEEWHVGVVGIVASRVVQEFYRPAVILGGCGEPAWRGSCRSIEGFDIGAALAECQELVVRAGGHTMAAGLSLAPANLERLRERLNVLAQASLQPDQLRPSLRLDAEVTLGQLTVKQVQELGRLETTGMANPGVQVFIRGLNLVQTPRRLGSDQQHLKLQVSDGTGQAEVVWWGAGEAQAPEGSFDLACAPRLNLFRGHLSTQLKLLDFALAGQRQEGQLQSQ